MKKKKMIGITVLLLAIGFAAVSTTLVLTGVIGVGSSDDFSVIFTKALLNGETSEKAVISADKKTITFTTDKMTMVDETQVLDYTVKNNSTQYDANVTINCTNLQSEYVTVVNTLDGTDITTDNETYMEAQESKDGDITVTMIKPYIEDEDTDLPITCNIVAEAVPRDDEVELGEDPIDDEPTVPDEITITDPDGKPATKPVILDYDGDKSDPVVPTPNGGVTPISGKRLTGIFFADDSTCNLLLGTCSSGTASRSGKLYDIVRAQTLGDVTTKNFDFTSYSDQNNGRGVYSTVETQSGIASYFYRGNVTNNNVRVGNTCWLIMHTTDGKGTKLLYNGNYLNGCGLYYVIKEPTADSTATLRPTSTYYFATGYTFDSKTGYYSLVNPVNDNYSSQYEGYYYASSDSGTSSISKIISYDSSTNKATVRRYENAINSSSHIGTNSTYNSVSSDKTFDGYMTAINADTVNTSDYSNAVYTIGTKGFKFGEVGTHYVVIYKSNLADYSISDAIDTDNVQNNNISLINPTNCASCTAENFVGKYTKLNKNQGQEIYYVGDFIKEDSSYYYFDGAQLFTNMSLFENTKSEAEASSNSYDSSIKKVVDSWYESNLKGTKYESYLEDTMFCNDRSVADNISNLKLSSINSDSLAFQLSPFLSGNSELRNSVINGLFGEFGRNPVIHSSITRYGKYALVGTPTYKCSRKVDRFTVSDTTVGNGKLKYPIALASGDELAFAGIGFNGTGYVDSFANGNTDYWTMTPGGVDDDAYMMYVSYGTISTDELSDYSKKVRPVISLVNSTIVKGAGTNTNPYVIVD